MTLIEPSKPPEQSVPDRHTAALAEAASNPTALSAMSKAALAIAQAQRDAAQAHLRGAQFLEASCGKLAAQMEEARAIALALENAHREANAAGQRLRAESEHIARNATLEAADFLSGSHPDFQNAIQFFTFDLAVTKRLAGSARSKWKMGEAFSLEAEPSNSHDPNAIKVLQNGAHVGYISAECAKKIKKMTASEGWRLTGEAYLASAKGGHWEEGRLQARMVNPIVGWSGFNPIHAFSVNLAAMESAILLAATAAPQGSGSAPARARAPSL